MYRCCLVLAAALIAGCGVRAPAPIDLGALVKRLGPVDARHELEVRLVDDPRDIAARLALAQLCDEQHRPSQAIEQLEVVAALGGPLGTRWHADDRARLGRLLAARGRARLARSAPTALADLERAHTLGARIGEDELVSAHLAHAVVELQHVDAKRRAAGRAVLSALAAGPRADPVWRGARPAALPAARGALGVWLWSLGARRAAWEELSAWHAASAPAPHPDDLQGAYLIARAWWTPYDGPPPAADELVGPERCRYRAARCNPWDLVQNATSSPAIAALTSSPPSRTADPDAALGWLAITLAGALRGEGAWGPSFASRVDLGAITVDAFPAGGRAAFARLAGREARDALVVDPNPPSRYLAAAAAALRGASPAEVRTALGPLTGTPDGLAILAIVAPEPAEVVASPLDAAIVGYVAAHAPMRPALAAPQLHRLLEAYARAPASADRIARDVVAEATDAAVAHAALGALYDALADPARARASWQAAVDASREPVLVRGLAEAIARAKDPDAALVLGTEAAAASGDPAPVWTDLARALHGVGANVHALEAARYAIDLASAETVADPLDLAIAASAALGRTTQVDELRARRAAVSPPVTAERTEDPTDPVAALAAYRAHLEPEMIARLWSAARWNPRDVAIRATLLDALGGDDPRRRTVVAELVALGGDREAERARSAIRVLRDHR